MEFSQCVEFSRRFCKPQLTGGIHFVVKQEMELFPRLRLFYTCIIYCQPVIKFCTMLFLSHHVYNGIIFILGDPISYVMFPIVNSERSDWVRNLPFESTN